MHVAFFAEQLYYLPQFAPVVRMLIERGHRVTTLLRIDEKLRDVAIPIDLPEVEAHTLTRVDHPAQAYAELRRLAPDWAVFGSFLADNEMLAPSTRTALVYHGIGVKNVLFDPRLNRFDLRCVESQRVLDELVAREPGITSRLELVGFAKLDPLLPAPPVSMGTDRPPVVLYAPTFYPSSLELMPEDLKSLAPGAHWIVKPHFFSWVVPQYEPQRERMKRWERAGIEVLGPERYDLVPLMARADVLISDASSALFEFAALGKPVVWCRFLKLRWSYRGLFAWRYKQRMDPNTPRYETVAYGVDKPAGLAGALQQALADRRSGKPPPVERETLIEHLIGPRDGQASARIVKALETRKVPPGRA
ncbi:CDP-glycerol glycerophosphotransferase family protein [Ideonella sp. DXS29W]|uniref:CDP-glycerol glycerophosphotransferase family protein n=1 Tax=Ideonella lacteola TaxID=2984193 RepID=A0ABU9BH46_9BURK